MLWLSSRHATIGAGLIAVCLPKKAAEESERSDNFFLYAGAPSSATATFMYVSATGLLTCFGPHLVAEGVALTDFQGGSLHLRPDLVELIESVRGVEDKLGAKAK
jgi:hypothetical protein